MGEDRGSWLFEPHWSIAALVVGLAAEAVKQARARKRPNDYRGPSRMARPYRSLRPGAGTPLWNELRRELRPHLKKYGQQANLGRMLGVPRQRVNSWVTRYRHMPDGERMLQLVAWLVAVKNGQRPS